MAALPEEFLNVTEQPSSPDISSLVKRLDELQLEVEKLKAESEIRKLHHKYGYYLDKCLYKEVVDLYADHPDTYVQFLGGKFKGIAGVRRLYVERFANHFVAGRNGPVQGFLLDHLLAQDIADYDPKTGIGKMRIRTLMSAGTHESLPPTMYGGKRQWWEGGVYENEYIKQDGVWKIFRLRYYPFWHGSFEHGWRYTPPEFIPMFKEVYPQNSAGPDELVEDCLWPDTRVVPFHYAHPVTGKQIAEDDLKAPIFKEEISTSRPARVISDAS